MNYAPAQQAIYRAGEIHRRWSMKQNVKTVVYTSGTGGLDHAPR
jgi:hypothetical protein